MKLAGRLRGSQIGMAYKLTNINTQHHFLAHTGVMESGGPKALIKNSRPNLNKRPYKKRHQQYPVVQNKAAQRLNLSAKFKSHQSFLKAIYITRSYSNAQG